MAGISIQEIESNMNRDLAYVNEWLLANKLSLNVVKTEFINKANTTLPGDISEPSAETSEEPVFHSVIINRSLNQGPV